MMNIEEILSARSDNKCELCSSDIELSVYQVPPITGSSPERSAMVCGNCREQLENKEKIDIKHWFCLSESMWSEYPAVQVIAWRMLKHLSSESWAQDLFDQLYLEEEVLQWAQDIGEANEDSEDVPVTKDSNGNILVDGDSVTLIKDLDVKGANFTAKRGTIVRRISLTSNPEHIEGKVNGTQIVLLTCYLKKV